jgi:dUTP pyrophosphatase
MTESVEEEEEEEIKIVLAEPGAQIPVRASPFSAGLDLRSSVSCTVKPLQKVLVSTGLIIQLPPGTMGKIESRSSLALQGVIALGGVCDSDYTGIYRCIIFNTNKDRPFRINVGDRIAQLVIHKIMLPRVKCVTENQLTKTERGSGGFGSSNRYL